MYVANRVRICWPFGVLTFVFVGSRVAARGGGVRFDTSPVNWYWQYADTGLLQHHLLNTLWYLHSQPPLFNLWLGINLKLFGTHYGPAAHVEFLTTGFLLCLLLYAMVLRVTANRAVSVVVTAIVVSSPAVILYENWLFYEYPVVVMLLATLLCLDRFIANRTFWSGSAFFVLVAMLVYTRSTFQLVWVALGLAIVLWAMPGARRIVLASSAVPLAAVCLLYVKNEVEFGVPSTTSWTGMYLAQVAYADLPAHSRLAMVADGALSKTSRVPPFSRIADYPDVLAHTRRTGVPVLDERLKAAHVGQPERGTPVLATNFNNLAYVKISNAYLHDAIRLIMARPGVYLSGVGTGLHLFFQPSSTLWTVQGNETKISAWDRWFNRIVLWQVWPLAPMSILIVLAYAFVGLYGFTVVRTARRRRDSISIVLLFAWMTVAYLFVLTTVGEWFENQRMQFVMDIPVLLLVVGAAVQLKGRIGAFAPTVVRGELGRDGRP
jgi:hypothetical protein